MRILIVFFVLALSMSSCITVQLGGGNNPFPGPNPVPGYNGRIGCGNVSGEAQFQQLRSQLASYNNSITRLDVAKSAVPRHCLTVSQIRQLTATWSNSFHREEFLHMAYDYTYDIDNYVNLQDLFSNSIMRKDFVEWCYAR